LLQIGSAPARLYKEYVAAEFSPVGRLLEFLLVRPFVLGVFLKATEMLLEVISLGFSVWRSLLNDFEIASLDERPYYPSHLLVHQKIDIRPEAGSAIVMLGAEATQDRRLGNTTGPRSGLHISLGEVTEEIKRQIQLRHSTYYENRAVIQRVAEFLVGGEEKFVGETRRSTSLKPSPDFWEVLLVGNIALAVLYFWIAGARLPHPIMPYVVASLGYVIPFAALGIIVVLYGAVRRHWPPRLWRWFWIIWAAWAFLCLVSALGTLLRP
jgi:hypothetical protein